MNETSYKRVSSGGATRCNGLRGFRVNIKKLSIQRLRVRILHVFKVLFKWRKSYERAVKSLKKGITRGAKSSSVTTTTTYNNAHNKCINNQSKTRLITEEKRRTDCRLRSLGRTNSFYSEAIADCLEFIKRNSISVDDPRSQ